MPKSIVAEEGWALAVGLASTTYSASLWLQVTLRPYFLKPLAHPRSSHSPVYLLSCFLVEVYQLVVFEIVAITLSIKCEQSSFDCI